MQEYTLGFLFRNGKIILAKKKRKIGAGKLNGYGGGIEQGEDKLGCIIREIKQESTVVVEGEKCKELGLMDFHFENKEEFVRVFIYRIDEFSGEPQETDEMGPPEEFDVDKIPYERMIVGNGKFISLVCEGKKFKGEYYYSENGEELVRFVLAEVPNENKEIKVR